MSNHLQQTLTASPEAVFHQLIDSRRLAVWFAEHADVSVPRHHYDFWGRYTPGTPDRDSGRHPLNSATPAGHLSYSWRYQGIESVIDFRLEPRGAETVVVLQQSGVGPEGPIDSPVPEDFWFLSLENLRRAVDGRDDAIVRLDYTASMLGDVHHSVEIEASPEEVFKVLIKPEQVNRWIASNADIDPRIGGRYDLGWGGMGPKHILDLVPNERLAIADEEGPEAGGQTVLTWTLAGSGGRTRLTFVHSGFAPDKDNSGIFTGWLNFMSWIKSLVEYGPAWHPTLRPLTPDWATYYPASIASRQAEILPLP